MSSSSTGYVKHIAGEVVDGEQRCVLCNQLLIKNCGKTGYQDYRPVFMRVNKGGGYDSMAHDMFPAGTPFTTCLPF